LGGKEPISAHRDVLDASTRWATGGGREEKRREKLVLLRSAAMIEKPDIGLARERRDQKNAAPFPHKKVRAIDISAGKKKKSGMTASQGGRGRRGRKKGGPSRSPADSKRKKKKVRLRPRRKKSAAQGGKEN